MPCQVQPDALAKPCTARYKGPSLAGYQCNAHTHVAARSTALGMFLSLLSIHSALNYHNVWDVMHRHQHPLAPATAHQGPAVKALPGQPEMP
jgi:hypothetical protein